MIARLTSVNATRSHPECPFLGLSAQFSFSKRSRMARKTTPQQPLGELAPGQTEITYDRLHPVSITTGDQISAEMLCFSLLRPPR
jgi:hypothetical protein